jgi:iron complex outermembrane recepter protein
MRFSTKTAVQALPPYVRTLVRIAATCITCFAPQAWAQDQDDAPVQLDELVVSASRSEQRQFDAPASINAVQIDPAQALFPLVGLPDAMRQVPGLQIRDRQNYAQDLQMSIRGFGTRSTFGIRGLRILVDGIPATMPDGQGQASSINLPAVQRIEVLRGPLAQLYGNAAGGVVQVFTRDPPPYPSPGSFYFSAGAGHDNQRQLGLGLETAKPGWGATADLSGYASDGYREHSAVDRRQLHAKLVSGTESGLKMTAVFDSFDQPLAEDPLGLTRTDFKRDPRQSIEQSREFDTRKSVLQNQAGLSVEQSLSAQDSVTGRIYYGQRQVDQTLAFAGGAPTSSGGVIALDRDYGGAALSWTRKIRIDGRPLQWTAGMETDMLTETRRGYVNEGGSKGALRRDERDEASNFDVYGQLQWAWHPQWSASAGLRLSRVRFSVDDRYVTPSNPDDSGTVHFHNTSPVAGLVWHVSDNINIYGNIGRGFETPTLAESAYRLESTGPNFALRPAVSLQQEIGMKLRTGRHALDIAVFGARTRDEIVPLAVENGRTIYQNVDDLRRKGIEVSLRSEWKVLQSRLSYTLLDARFREAFQNARGERIASGNRLPGVPLHSIAAGVDYRPYDALTTSLEMIAESKTYVDDLNSDTAPGYLSVNAGTSYAVKTALGRLLLTARIDNLFDKSYAASVIVNEGNQRFFEPAAGRRLFLGLRMDFN